jgi:hypothetical protein
MQAQELADLKNTFEQMGYSGIVSFLTFIGELNKAQREEVFRTLWKQMGSRPSHVTDPFDFFPAALRSLKRESSDEAYKFLQILNLTCHLMAEVWEVLV